MGVAIYTAYNGRAVPDSVPQDHTLEIRESSGHGALSFLETPDDDVTEEDDYGQGEAGAKGDGISDLPPHGAEGPFFIRPDLEKVTCFRCHGKNNKGCDILDMLNDVDFFSMKCVGKCMNISSGKLAVYDCAHDMVRNENRCIKSGDTEMCFCAGNYCNGPGDVKRFYANDMQLQLPPHPAGQGAARANGTSSSSSSSSTEMYGSEEYGDFSEDRDSHELRIDNETDSGGIDRTVVSPRWQGQKYPPKGGRRPGHGSPWDEFGEQDRKKTRIHGRKYAHSQQGGLYLDHTEQGGLAPSEIDVIIPKHLGELSDNETSSDGTTEYPVVENNIPRVGKLKDSSALSDNQASAAVFSALTMLLCQIFCVI
ncbi:hypothetical protein Btru_050746 [Bulinus truncatus]|nr:hypothetical protein Btru_050746 [Bulinus truncatus]